MPSFIKHTINKNDFILSSDSVIFWEQEKILILSDLHLGKSGHFRKSGIAIPQAVMKEDMQRLITALQFFKPLLVVIVGDLFHSVANKEHELFLKWRNDLQHIAILLVKGNHDIVPNEWYAKANITIAEKYWCKNNFLFIHQIEDVATVEIKEDVYFFTGHIHPAISIKGLGKQSLRFPCFYFAAKHAVLPAFGKFTGTYLVVPKKNEKVFAIVEDSFVLCHS